MSKKNKEIDGQKSLKYYLTPKCKEAITEPSVTPIHLHSAKKRTPPSNSEDPAEKRANLELPSQQTSFKRNLIKELQATQLKKMNEDTEESHTIQDYQKKNPSLSVTDENETEELPRKMILYMKRAMQELITPIEDKLNQLLDTKIIQEQQAIEITQLKNSQSELYRKCLKFEMENDKLKKRIEKLESTMLEGNLIMHGLKEDEWELEENRRERIYHAIASTVDADDRRARLDIARSIPIRTTTRLGKYKAGKNCPISIAFEKKSHADVLFESKSWLPCGVYIDQEYTPEIEGQQKLLQPILKLARGIEKYQGKCKLVDNYLVIQGKRYGTHDLHLLPSELSGFHVSSRSDANRTVHAFFGELSPFNNFHRAPFNHKGISFFCTEQFIKLKKALLFNDKDTMDKILISTNPLECKDLGKNVKGYNEEVSKKNAEHLCYPGLLAKFQTHDCLRDILLSTGNMTLVEATYNTMWGTGVPLHMRDSVNENKWTS